MQVEVISPMGSPNEGLASWHDTFQRASLAVPAPSHRPHGTSSSAISQQRSFLEASEPIALLLERTEQMLVQPQSRDLRGQNQGQTVPALHKTLGGNHAPSMKDSMLRPPRPRAEAVSWKVPHDLPSTEQSFAKGRFQDDALKPPGTMLPGSNSLADGPGCLGVGFGEPAGAPAELGGTTQPEVHLQCQGSLNLSGCARTGMAPAASFSDVPSSTTMEMVRDLVARVTALAPASEAAAHAQGTPQQAEGLKRGIANLGLMHMDAAAAEVLMSRLSSYGGASHTGGVPSGMLLKEQNQGVADSADEFPGVPLAGHGPEKRHRVLGDFGDMVMPQNQAGSGGDDLRDAMKDVLQGIAVPMASGMCNTGKYSENNLRGSATPWAVEGAGPFGSQGGVGYARELLRWESSPALCRGTTPMPLHVMKPSLSLDKEREKRERQKALNREAGRRMRQRRAARLAELEDTVGKLKASGDASAVKLEQAERKILELEGREVELQTKSLDLIHQLVEAETLEEGLKQKVQEFLEQLSHGQ